MHSPANPLIGVAINPFHRVFNRVSVHASGNQVLLIEIDLTIPKLGFGVDAVQPPPPQHLLIVVDFDCLAIRPGSNHATHDKLIHKDSVLIQ